MVSSLSVRPPQNRPGFNPRCWHDCWPNYWPSSCCHEWVASLFRPSKVKPVGKAMANHPWIPMSENRVPYDLATSQLRSLTTKVKLICFNPINNQYTNVIKCIPSDANNRSDDICFCIVLQKEESLLFFMSVCLNLYLWYIFDLFLFICVWIGLWLFTYHVN